MATRKSASLPLWNDQLPVTFLADDFAYGRENLSPAEAIDWRGICALGGIRVSCWQGGLKVAVPMVHGI